MISSERNNLSKKANSSINASFIREIFQSQTMLKHATGSGFLLSSEIVSPIVTAREMLESGKWIPSVEDAFWVAASKLAVLLKPVTTESLGEQSIQSAKVTRKWLLLVTVLLLIILVPFSIVT